MKKQQQRNQPTDAPAKMEVVHEPDQVSDHPEGTGAERSAPVPGQPITAVRWEYRRVTAGSEKVLLELANLEGSEGWELVAAAQGRNADVPTLFFKRRL